MSDADKAQLVLIDDELAFVEALGLAISMTPDLVVVGKAGNAADGRDLLRRMSPDLVVVDYRLPDGATGIDVAREARGAGTEVPIVVLTSYLAPRVRREAGQVKGLTCVSKQQGVVELITAFREAMAGSGADSAEAVEGVLSEGELEVLEAINDGRTAAEIAGQLHLSIHTIRSRIKSILKKLEVSSQVEAVAKATRLGLLVPPA